VTAHKYTSDGRKVLVVGKLNATEHIVQEIFVAANGQEIASGENFVVKGLHDAPVESWKTKDLREREERYERDKAELERRSKETHRRLESAIAKAKLRASALLEFAEHSEDAQVQRLRAFLAGEITHLFIDGSDKAVSTWDSDTMFQVDNEYGRSKIEAIKLVSLLGRSDGRLDYKLHRYYDGSGRDECTIVPCRSYEEALAEAQKALDAEAEAYVAGKRGWFTPTSWKGIKGIQIPAAAQAKFDTEKRQGHTNRLATLRADIAKVEAELAAMV
jgi:hypothetical protein